MTKVDLPLWSLVTERERLRAEAEARGDQRAAEHETRPLHVDVRFHGDLAALTAAGFPLLESSVGQARGQLSPAQIRALDARDNVWLISLPMPARLTLDRSVPEIRGLDAWGAGVGATDVARGKGRDVVVGIIDSGIDVWHGSFRNPDGTSRILALWDQTFTYNTAGAPVDAVGDLLIGALQPTDETGAVATRSRAPVRILSTLDYGIEFTQAQINTALTAHPDGKNLPKSLRDQPVVHPSKTIFHGTHVAGIAAGNGSQRDRCAKPFTYIGVAPQADLVIVKTGVGGGQPNAILNLQDAVRYIFGVAARPEAPRLPTGRAAVVNISLGGHFGPHNGFGQDAMEFDRLTSGALAAGRAIVISAGNDRDCDLHAAFTIPPGTMQRVRVNLIVNSSSFLRLWGTVNPAATLTCVVRMPSSGPPVQQTAALTVTAGSGVITLGPHNVQVNPFLTPPADPDRHFNVTVAGQSGGRVTSGVWEFDFAAGAGGAPAANLHLWVGQPTDYDVAIQPFGTPSAEDVAANRRLQRPPEWIGATITQLASCRRAITVAAYNAEEAGTPLATYSAQGPAPNNLAAGLYDRPNVIAKPEIAAPGIAIDSARAEARRCCLECECCVDRYVPDEGTSMASPHIAGVVALMFAQNPQLTLDQIKTRLPNGVRPPPAMPGGTLAADLWGAGRVNAQGAVQAAAMPLDMTPDIVPDSSSPAEPERAPAIAPVSWADRLRAWNQVLDPHPAWHLCASLVSQHFDEVKRLIDTNRRIATLWHRQGGPGLVRGFVFGDAIPDPPIPPDFASGTSPELLTRFLTLLGRFGGDALRADIIRYAPLAHRLSGASWDELDRLVAQNGGV